MEISPTHSMFLTIFLTLFIPSSILITAKSLDYPSFVIPPVSWLVNTIEGLFLKPILVNGKFTCGFHSESDGFIFAISFTPKLNDSTLSPLVVWSANRNNPVGPFYGALNSVGSFNAVLNFTREGDLILDDGNGTSVWSTNTTDMPVSGLSLTTQGNLVLLGKNNKVIWQSFDHPTDSLVPGQRLVPGKKLRSSISISNSSEGLYSLEIKNDGELVAYMETGPLQPYYQSYVVTGNVTGKSYVDFKTIASKLLPFEELSIIMFDSDGHLKGYLWTNLSWVDLLDISPCDYPLVCGKYGFCSGSGSCSCNPENTTDRLMPIYDTQMELWCYLYPPISCEFPQDQRLVQLHKYSIPYFTLASKINNTNEEDCMQACLKSCSCKAVIFQYGYSIDYTSCSLVSEVFSFKTSVYDANRFIKRFVKVQDFRRTPMLVPPGNKGKSRAIIIGSTLGVILVILFAVIGLFFLQRYRHVRRDEDDSKHDGENAGKHIKLGLTRFSYDYLSTMTENFSVKLGEGGFGSVFYGSLLDGTKIAVKCLDGSVHVKKSFLAEMETLRAVNHTNLVTLIGFCVEKRYCLLVYGYMQNGSLDKWIFNTKPESALSWKQREKIIHDVAEGLSYLHDGCDQKILHLDIKPQNILLDENFKAQLADFGLSKLIGKDQNQVLTTMRGTPGYMAPEWSSATITEKVDVYSFGIVVMEILCGRKNVDRSQSEEEIHLLRLFKKKAEEGRFVDLVDQASEDMVSNEAEAVKMMRLAAWCLQAHHTRRPTMLQVLYVLKRNMEVEIDLDFDFLNPKTPGATGAPRSKARTTTLAFPSILSGPR